MTKYIVVGFANDFTKWKDEDYEARRHAFYVWGTPVIHGLNPRDFKLVLLGEYWKLSDWPEMEKLLKERGFLPS